MVRQKKRGPWPAPKGAGAGAPHRPSASGIWLWYHENKRWMPLLVLVFGGALLFILWNIEPLKNPVAFLAGLGWIVGYGVWGVRQPPDAPARPGRSAFYWPMVALVALCVAGFGWVYVSSVYRGAPVRSATLRREGDKVRFRLDRPKQTLVVVVHGSFAPDVGQSAEGNYSVLLSRGSRESAVEGKLERSTSRTRIRRGVRGASTTAYTYGIHEVGSLGAGEYTVEHLGVDDTLRSRLRVAIYTTWASRLVVIAAGAAAFLLALFLDVRGSRAGHRTRAGSAVATIAAFAEGFRSMAAPDALAAGVIVGVLASVLAGGGLGWVSDQLAKRAGGESGKRGRDEEEEEDDER